MTVQPEPDNRLICPNCQALNAPYATICVSCGVQMEEFRAALPRLQQLKLDRAVSHQEMLKDEVTVQIKNEVHRSVSAFRKLLLFLLLSAIIAGIIISIAAYLYANQVKRTQEEIQAKINASLACLRAEKYVCAKDGFQELIVSGADSPQLIENLNLAQHGLAKQYYESGQWEKAINELEDLLQRDPGNQQAVALLKDSYSKWIEQLGLEGRWLKKWAVRREMDARFPPGDK